MHLLLQHALSVFYMLRALHAATAAKLLQLS
jgi:hypothetical protein